MTDLTLDTQVRLADVRLKVLNREPVTADEFRTLLRDLTRDREGAARASAAAKRKATKTLKDASSSPAAPNLDEFFPGTGQ